MSCKNTRRIQHNIEVCVIRAGMDSLLQKAHQYKINLEKPFAIKVKKHTICGYSVLTQCSFDATKIKHDYYRGKDSMKKFCIDLREHAMEIIECEKWIRCH